MSEALAEVEEQALAEDAIQQELKADKAAEAEEKARLEAEEAAAEAARQSSANGKKKGSRPGSKKSSRPASSAKKGKKGKKGASDEPGAEDLELTFQQDEVAMAKEEALKAQEEAKRPGDSGYEFSQLPIEPALAEVLAPVWGTIEQVFVKDSQYCFAQVGNAIFHLKC